MKANFTSYFLKNGNLVSSPTIKIDNDVRYHSFV